MADVVSGAIAGSHERRWLLREDLGVEWPAGGGERGMARGEGRGGWPVGRGEGKEVGSG